MKGSPLLPDLLPWRSKEDRGHESVYLVEEYGTSMGPNREICMGVKKQESLDDIEWQAKQNQKRHGQDQKAEQMGSFVRYIDKKSLLWLHAQQVKVNSQQEKKG